MLELVDVHAGYGATPVLRGVDLTVADGAVVALLGPNGAGKTTLLRVASGLLRPTRGALVLDGDEQRPSPHRLARAGICHVPEGHGVFGSLTVREHLGLFCRDGDEAEALDRAVAAFPRLGERMHQEARTMSGGEQQMLALARAYIQRPRFVLLDEVSMGLAPRVVEEIYAFLARLAAEGSGLLVVEQYVHKALAIADVVYLMHKGQIGFAGPPADLDGADLAGAYVGAGSVRPA